MKLITKYGKCESCSKVGKLTRIFVGGECIEMWNCDDCLKDERFYRCEVCDRRCNHPLYYVELGPHLQTPSSILY